MFDDFLFNLRAQGVKVASMRSIFRSTSSAATQPELATPFTPGGPIRRNTGIAPHSSANRQGIWSARLC